MDANQLYEKLSENWVNHYFGSYEELNVILDNAQYPCLLVIPVSKRLSFIADRYKVVDTVVVALASIMDVDYNTLNIYKYTSVLEKLLLRAIYPLEKNIANYQCLSELNKFDANVVFAAFSMDLVNDPICNN